MHSSEFVISPPRVSSERARGIDVQVATSDRRRAVWNEGVRGSCTDKESWRRRKATEDFPDPGCTSPGEEITVIHSTRLEKTPQRSRSDESPDHPKTVAASLNSLKRNPTPMPNRGRRKEHDQYLSSSPVLATTLGPHSIHFIDRSRALEITSSTRRTRVSQRVGVRHTGADRRGVTGVSLRQHCAQSILRHISLTPQISATFAEGAPSPPPSSSEHILRSHGDPITPLHISDGDGRPFLKISLPDYLDCDANVASTGRVEHTHMLPSA